MIIYLFTIGTIVCFIFNKWKHVFDIAAAFEGYGISVYRYIIYRYSDNILLIGLNIEIISFFKLIKRIIYIIKNIDPVIIISGNKSVYIFRTISNYSIFTQNKEVCCGIIIKINNVIFVKISYGFILYFIKCFCIFLQIKIFT